MHALPNQAIEKTIQVDAIEFESMLVSNRNLLRCDFRSNNTRGLYDPNSRTRYFVTEHDLFLVPEGELPLDTVPAHAH